MAEQQILVIDPEQIRQEFDRIVLGMDLVGPDGASMSRLKELSDSLDTEKPESIVNQLGMLIRAGLYRGLADPNSLAYAKATTESTSDSNCSFSPSRLSSVDGAVKKRNGTWSFPAKPPYSSYAGYFVDHSMLTPGNHIQAIWELTDDELEAYYDLVVQTEEAALELGQIILFYLRSPDNLAKSIPHLHGHILRVLLETVEFLAYLSNARTGGVLALKGKAFDGGFSEEVVNNFYGGDPSFILNQAGNPVSIDEIGNGTFQVYDMQDGFIMFDGHKVDRHQRIVLADKEKCFKDLTLQEKRRYIDYLRDRNESLMKDLGEYKDKFTQDFPRSLVKPGFFADLLTLEYDYLDTFWVNGNERGATFISPTTEQVLNINEMRARRDRAIGQAASRCALAA